MGHVKVTLSSLLERINKTFMTLKLMTLYTKTNLVDFGHILNIKLLIWSTVKTGKKHSNFHISYLFFPTTKKTSLLHGPPRSEMSYFWLQLTGDKFAIYVPIRRYGDFNTLQ
jgi:hypothetical protein